jgi:hypothetical protein
MQKLLFLLFFGCLSANVWAQKTDTTALITQVLTYYTEPKFLDTVKNEVSRILAAQAAQELEKYHGGNDGSEHASVETGEGNPTSTKDTTFKPCIRCAENLVFYQYKKSIKSDAIFRNVWVWNKKTRTLSFTDIIPFHIAKNGKNYAFVPIYTDFDTKKQTGTLKIDAIHYFQCTSINPTNVTIVEDYDYNQTKISTIFSDNVGEASLPDAVLKYNKTTRKYEIQAHNRQSERRNWFAFNYLLLE